MKHRLISILLLLSMLLSLLPATAFAAEEAPVEIGAEVQTVTLEGKGTAADPYRIATAETLVYAAEQMNADTDQTSYAAAHYVLTDDIDMQGVTYAPFPALPRIKRHTLQLPWWRAKTSKALSSAAAVSWTARSMPPVCPR